MGFGGASKTKAKPKFTGIQVQTSSSVLPVALVGGMARVALNLAWYGDFKSHVVKQKAGKGFGGSAKTDEYTASIIGILSEGPINGVGRAWKEDGEVSSYTAFGFTLFTGTIPQSPWGYLTTSHPTQADGYPGAAYLAKANDDLGASATLSNRSFEVQGLHYMTGVGGTLPDADPALWIDLFLCDADKGAGVPVALIDQAWLFSSPAAATTGDSAFQTYCQAMGFAISPALVDQDPAAEGIIRWTTVCNTAPVWNGSALKFVPFGDTDVTANGVTYLAPTAVCYDLDDDDYQQSGDADPVTLSRSDPLDAKNLINLIVLDRANAYNETPVPYKDDNAIALYGPKEAESITCHDVADPAMAGTMIALVGQRILYVRNSASFTLSPRYDRLEPMDVVTVTDAALGLDKWPVRIVEILEDEDDSLSIIAEQFTGTVGHNTGANTPGATPTPVNSLADPGPVNDPIIFEMAGRAQVGLAISGGDPNWGGAEIHVSTDGGASYQAIGQQNGPARMGVTTASLASYGGSNPDTGGVLSVDLSISRGDLVSVTSAEAASEVTLSLVRDAGGGNVEFLSYQDATLTGTYAYDLETELYRNLHATTGGTHAAGSDFARIDGNIFWYDLPPAWIGQPLKLKFPSFNIWGQALEDISTVTAYDYTPTGLGFGAGTGVSGAPVVASEDITPTGGFALVSYWDDSGTQKIRFADATDDTRPCHAFVLSAVATGATGIPYFSGEVTDLAASWTAGQELYLATTPGQLTATIPTSSGALQQSVAIATGPTTARVAPMPRSRSDIAP